MNKIRELRKAKGLSQRKLSEFTGVNLDSIQAYETGRRKIGMNNAWILADYFHVSIDYLVGRSDVR
ncbi:helix-turn-helix domain-containing protein [Leuconostoc mesenteroides]|uniref:helix-turn-helix domain-containing protein n=1 Tax=Leuconostoc mesenteroides TaxID=1245 RepID=UPI001FBBDFE9|nr:helix-turn-helix transcriptional regulator [Leuconostoc mesenteroides]MCJ2160627.1 helix-turn-helix domain-containing protein [Leuconostoc mesenteroides]MCM6836530.1 helix-turn-helix domain-containing protein [Leuconostoc mesenteroides]